MLDILQILCLVIEIDCLQAKAKFKNFEHTIGSELRERTAGTNGITRFYTKYVQNNCKKNKHVCRYFIHNCTLDFNICVTFTSPSLLSQLFSVYTVVFHLCHNLYHTFCSGSLTNNFHSAVLCEIWIHPYLNLFIK